MKRIGILLCCIVLCLLFPEKVHAEEIVSEKEPVDIIFVIDCSGSMKTNDVSRMGLSMVQAFVDTVQAEDIRIGYVAYNDSILSYSAPKSIALAEEREALKEEIGAITYSRDTDIGLGVSYACELLSAEKNTRKIMVLISDGETDLPQGKERTEEQSNQELEQCVCQCQEEGIQIYTVAFGQYDGSKTVLEEIAMQTEAESYSAQGPEDLIEILYGIFQDNLIYQIQKFSSGTYAGGSQEIRCVLDALYLDEINIVLISSKPIGEATVQYGGEEILLTGLSHYAVGKIENVGENQTGKELIIHSKTEEGQDLQVYVISYRGLTPVLEMTTDAERNQHLEYWVYFKDRNENIIKNTEFYNSFLWKLADDDADMVQEYVNVSEGVLKGSLQFPHSGIYMLRGTLSDDFGNYSFSAQVKVINEIPNGSIPEEDCTVLDGERILNLDEFFTDPNGDILTYSVTGVQEGVEVGLEGNLLTITPRSAGTHIVTLQVSDGEDAIQYAYRIKVIPIWQAYWWVAALILIVGIFVLWKILHKPRPELKSVLNKEVGLRTGGTLSHVCVFEIPGIDRLLFLTDVAFMTYPTLEEKVQIIKNTIPVCNACGVAEPKVAPLAAVEVVNPKMPVTVDAAELTKMCEEGQIPGCIVDGPLSLDLAIDPEAAKHKGATDRKIQGDADVLLFPDIHAGNLVYKAIVHMVKVKNGCILTGTKVPVVLTSRSDTFETKVYSLALAAVVAEEMKKNQK